MKSKLEYIWLDGYHPTQSLRSKTMVRDNFGGTLEECPMWSFDGSSTEQADGNDSDCLLKPVAIIPDPDRQNAYLVMTEVLNADGSAHVSNGRATIDEGEDDEDFWFGFEQEYFLWDTETNRPPGFPAGGFPDPQGPYYCSVGGKGAKRAGDEIWLGRYLLERTAEKYGFAIEWHPKPLGDTDWNGSGMHANFSNGAMRDQGDEAVFHKICEAFGKNIERHISVYGADNHQRLTGKHETQSIDEFSYGVSDRGASIRIPVGTVEDGWKGRLEDRRPASNADPYKVAAAIVKTCKEAEA